MDPLIKERLVQSVRKKKSETIEKMNSRHTFSSLQRKHVGNDLLTDRTEYSEMNTYDRRED